MGNSAGKTLHLLLVPSRFRTSNNKLGQELTITYTVEEQDLPLVYNVETDLHSYDAFETATKKSLTAHNKLKDNTSVEIKLRAKESERIDVNQENWATVSRFLWMAVTEASDAQQQWNTRLQETKEIREKQAATAKSHREAEEADAEAAKFAAEVRKLKLEAEAKAMRANKDITDADSAVKRATAEAARINAEAELAKAKAAKAEAEEREATAEAARINAEVKKAKANAKLARYAAPKRPEAEKKD